MAGGASGLSTCHAQERVGGASSGSPERVPTHRESCARGLSVHLICVFSLLSTSIRPSSAWFNMLLITVLRSRMGKGSFNQYRDVLENTLH